ncbi:MAG: hypothetical protein EP297_01970 [Gammaproteobacteria bacterium]|nr:MAG: hypothetical protein EP297_01970 [Gammaproteobacteria bacterium]
MKLHGLDIPAVDVQRTLCEFTAVTVSQAIQQYAGDATKLILCGGGTKNTFLRSRLATHLPDIKIQISSKYGIDPEWIEAAAFAWLAYRTMHNLPGNIPSVTGASHPVILGAIYPGHSKE